MSFNILIPAVNVPAVSTMSSMMIAVLPSTSPIKFIASATFGLGRRLSMIAIGAPNAFAKLRARTAPP